MFDTHTSLPDPICEKVGSNWISQKNVPFGFWCVQHVLYKLIHQSLCNIFIATAIDYLGYQLQQKKELEAEVERLRKGKTALEIMKTYVFL